jgi:sugar phosphate isomerase/epimerase
MFSRRAFLAASTSALTMAACTGLPVAPTSPSRRVAAVGIQTYTLRDAMQTDMPATLAMIKRSGYDYVELNRGDFANRAPAVLREHIDAAGLFAPSTHLSYAAVRDETATIAETCQILGCEYGVVPWMDEGERTLADWVRHAEVLNEAGKVFKDNGVQLAYHNHQFEFSDLGDGTTAMQILLEGTDPDLVCFEIDIFWAYLASADLPSLFAANPGRFKLCHIKDMRSPPPPDAMTLDYPDIAQNLMVNVGEGVIDFASLFALNDVSGLGYFITEHDALPAPFEASIKTSHDTVRALRF